jgi:CubicO group peptidase (beta-lactamase class C family)
MIDYETYDTDDGRRYAAIWERRADRPAYQIRTNRTQLDFANLWRTYRDEGYRLADFEGDEASPNLYGGIWIENAARFRFPLKGALDTAITSYLATYTDTSSAPASQTGISVVVIQDGDVVYRRGFGMADVAGGKVAHAATVYGYASVSKVIGGTLAALLEAEGSLRDGTSFTLDMGDPTSDYLADLPAHHTHTVEQLTAHLGCVVHYPSDTQPGVANLTTHFPTAVDAAEAIWDIGLVTTTAARRAAPSAPPAATRPTPSPCSARSSRRRPAARSPSCSTASSSSRRGSTPCASSSRPRPRSRTTSAPFSTTTASNPVDLAGCGLGNACDNSWKVLGGGIEGDALDLARFGWRVLDGRVVDATTRDERLWTPVDASCAAPGGGTCRNGVGWELRTVGGRRRGRARRLVDSARARTCASTATTPSSSRS